MFLIFLLSLCVSLPVFAGTNNSELAKKVIELRKEVELLNDEYKTEREKVLSEIKALSIQKAELASNLRNEEIRHKQLIDKMTSLKKEIGDSSIESEELKPVILKTIAEMKAWIDSSLPFKQAERRQSLEQLEQRIVKKEVSVIKAANQLWALIEDEKRLARETSLHRQSISMNGKMHLAEVVKVGMLYMYFKSENGQIGMAVKNGEQWNYVPFKVEEKQKQTLAFFESLKKQIRQGYFDIPTEI